MKNEILKIDAPELSVIEKSKSDQIKATFEPMAKMLSEFESQVNEIISESENEITKELTLKAKRVRLDIGKVRIETGKLKDKQKEYIKLEDKAIMGVHNILVWAVKEKEDKLKSIEDYFEIQEQKRIELLQSERVEKLSIYVEDAHERDLAKFADDEFEALLAMKKKEQEDRIAAENKAEEERIAKEKAEAEERKRIAAENEKLKKEAEKREQLAKIEAEKRAEEEKRKIALDKAGECRRELLFNIGVSLDFQTCRNMSEIDWNYFYKEKMDKFQAEQNRIYLEKLKEEKERKEQEAKLLEEQKKAEKLRILEASKARKLAEELKSKAEAELKAKEDEEARLQSELNKGDIEKVNDLINDLELLKTKYSFKSDKNKNRYAEVSTLLSKVILHIKKQLI